MQNVKQAQKTSFYYFKYKIMNIYLKKLDLKKMALDQN